MHYIRKKKKINKISARTVYFLTAKLFIATIQILKIGFNHNLQLSEEMSFKENYYFLIKHKHSSENIKGKYAAIICKFILNTIQLKVNITHGQNNKFKPY